MPRRRPIVNTCLMPCPLSQGVLTEAGAVVARDGSTFEVLRDNRLRRRACRPVEAVVAKASEDDLRKLRGVSAQAKGLSSSQVVAIEGVLTLFAKAA